MSQLNLTCMNELLEWKDKLENENNGYFKRMQDEAENLFNIILEY